MYGALAVGSSPVDFACCMRNERTQLQALIAKSNIRVDGAMDIALCLGHGVLRLRLLAVSVPFYTAVLGLRAVARLRSLGVALHHARDHRPSQSL